MSELTKLFDKQKRYWDEKVNPEGGTTKRLFNEGATYLTKKYGEKGDGDTHAEGQAMNIVSSQIPNFQDIISDEMKDKEEPVTEPGTQATMARSRLDLYDKSTANRRNIAMTNVNPNKGKKHSVLTQKKGGR